MFPSHANKQGKRYHYYITHEQQRADRSQLTWRVPAHDLEQMVIDNLRGFLCDGGAIHNAIDIHDGAENETSLQWPRTAAASLAEEIAARLGKCRGHLADKMRISYLAPDIVAGIVEGRQPVSLKRKTLMATPLSLDWPEQRRQLGFA